MFANPILCPVYKFIESLNGRILITDEVGLGKSIEAGLIWTEMRARSDAWGLLVVCPSMLREKWKKELKDRFNVSAQIYDSRGLIGLVGDFLHDGDNFQCAAIAPSSPHSLSHAPDCFPRAGRVSDQTILRVRS